MPVAEGDGHAVIDGSSRLPGQRCPGGGLRAAGRGSESGPGGGLWGPVGLSHFVSWT